MTDRYKLTLRESAPGSPPDLLERIKETIDDLSDCGTSTESDYIRQENLQEISRANSLREKALGYLADLESERQALLSEREQLRCEDRQKMYELKTKRIEVVISSLARLQELGVEIRLEVFMEPLILALADKGGDDGGPETLTILS